jgi:Integrase zinc binding domain
MMIHDAQGHPGILQTLSAVHLNFHWPGLKEDIVKFVKCCSPFQKIKATLPPPHLLTLPDLFGPLQHVHLDLFGPFPLHINVKGDSGGGGGVWVVNLIDHSPRLWSLLWSNRKPHSNWPKLSMIVGFVSTEFLRLLPQITVQSLRLTLDICCTTPHYTHSHFCKPTERQWHSRAHEPDHQNYADDTF